MKHYVIAAVSMALLVSGHVFAADMAQKASFEAECQKYAQEDGVEEAQMEDYLAQCVADMAQGQTEGEPEQAEEAGEAQESQE